MYSFDNIEKELNKNKLIVKRVDINYSFFNRECEHLYPHGFSRVTVFAVSIDSYKII